MAPPSITPAPPATASLGVTSAGDVRRVTDHARRLAISIGFTPAEGEEVALAVSELASNLVRHAGGGQLVLQPLQIQDRKGIQIESSDSGPGILNAELALTDGFSTNGGLGNGLGTVNRLMDQLEFRRLAPGGVQILCQRWVRPSTRTHMSRRLTCGAATRPCRTFEENGDAILIRHWSDQALLGVIDGLGHGPFAQKAAQAARAYVEHHFDQPLRDVFRGVGRTCQATRGVVMTLARFDLTREIVSIAGIGNIEVRLVGAIPSAHLVTRRGILGLHAPEPLVTERHWNTQAMLIMHSDGVRTRWNWDDYAPLAHEAPALIARRLLQDLGNPQDDATVLVARNAAS